MQEIQTTFTSLTGIKDVFLPLNLLSSLVGQVTQMMMIVARKNQYIVVAHGNLSSIQATLLAAHKELEFMCLENASLNQLLVE